MGRATKARLGLVALRGGVEVSYNVALSHKTLVWAIASLVLTGLPWFRYTGVMVQRALGYTVVFLVACGGGEGGGGVALGALEGSYDITDAVDRESELWETTTPTCLLKVSASKVSADCSKTDGNATEILSVDATIKEELVSADLVYTRDWGLEEPCFVSAKKTTTIVASVSKNSGAMVDGVFSPIAGDWTGSLTIEVQYDHELISGAPGFCSEGSDDSELYLISFDVTVAGSIAQVSWMGEGESGSFDIVGSENIISVDGEVISK